MSWNRDAQINLFILGFLWAVGTACGLFLNGFLLLFYGSILGLVLTCWVIWREGWSRAGFVLIFGILLGLLRIFWLMQFEVVLQTDQLAAQTYQVKVVSLVDRQGVEQSFVGSLVSNGQLLQVRVVDERQVFYGDVWKIRTDLIGNSAEKNSLKKWRLLKDGLSWTTGRAVLLSKVSNSGSLQSMIFVSRDWLLQILQENLREPAASLSGGILIGQRASIPSEILKDFQTVGLTHILAISGFNITLIINLLIFFLARVGRFWRLFWAIVLISFFVILTGASASVVRAAVMGLLIFSVKIMHRKVTVFKAITMSTFLIIWFKPLYWDFDLSFQLSLFATLSLVWFGDILLEKFDWSWSEMIKEGIILTVAAQVLTLPLMFYSFGRVSLISPIANLLVAPLVPIAMLVSSIVVATGVLGIGFLPGGFLEFIFQIMLWIAHGLAVLPLAQIEIGQDNLWLALLWYLAVFILFRRRKLDLD